MSRRDGLRDAKPEAIAAAQRPGTKQAQLIAMLQAPVGAAIAEIAGKLEWRSHYADARIMPM